jgi:hypothetical protein
MRALQRSELAHIRGYRQSPNVAEPYCAFLFRDVLDVVASGHTFVPWSTTTVGARSTGTHVSVRQGSSDLTCTF